VKTPEQAKPMRLRYIGGLGLWTAVCETSFTNIQSSSPRRGQTQKGSFFDVKLHQILLFRGSGCGKSTSPAKGRICCPIKAEYKINAYSALRSENAEDEKGLSN
jgi:hypothetical protein